jgi:LysR family transcriptional regulator, nitrogen assimilation regulatory protein
MSDMTSMIDPKWSIFIKVTELGSVTHAAVTLGVPQSVVSRQINLLEREAGGRLFRRTGRGVVLTDFGQKVFPGVKALVAQADQLADEIRTSAGEPVGTVRVGLLPSSVRTFVGALYQACIRRFPRVQLHFTEGSSVQLEDWLNQGRLDLSLLLREDDAESQDEPTLRRVQLSLIGPPGDPITSQSEVSFENLARLPLVLPGEPHLLRARLDALARERNIKLNISVEADSLYLQEATVAAGGGYAIVAARELPPDHIAVVSSARIVNPELTRRLVLSTTVLRPHTLATRAISALIQELSAAGVL